MSPHSRRHQKTPKESTPHAGPAESPGNPERTSGPSSVDDSGSFDYRKLGLRNPRQEFEEYAKQRISVAQKLGQTEDVEIYLEAFELGKSLLGRKREEKP